MTYVVCKKGHKLGQDAATLLRAESINAESLKGGNMAWQTDDMPTIAFSKLADMSKLWVTKQRPKIDRIACPWLIKRFIDKDAKFLFEEVSQVEAVAEKFAATPFDVENVTMSHRGDNCTFDTILEMYDLNLILLQIMQIYYGGRLLGRGAERALANDKARGTDALSTQWSNIKSNT